MRNRGKAFSNRINIPAKCNTGRSATDVSQSARASARWRVALAEWSYAISADLKGNTYGQAAPNLRAAQQVLNLWEVTIMRLLGSAVAFLILFLSPLPLAAQREIAPSTSDEDRVSIFG